MKITKQLFIRTFTISLIFCIWACKAPPELAINPQLIKLGEVKTGSKKVLNIQLKNTGGSSLEILDINGSCGCTELVLKSKVIKPGENTMLKMTYTAEAAASKSEQIKGYIVLRTNDKKRIHEIIFSGLIIK